jgi:hypothetical protein
VVVMENSALRVGTPYSPLKVNHRFGGTCCLHHLIVCLLHACLLLGLLFNLEDKSLDVSPRLTFNELHGVTS